MSISMEASIRNINAANTYRTKHFNIAKYINKCFRRDVKDAISEIGNFIPNDTWLIYYKEISILNGIPYINDQNYDVPTQYLENYYILVQEREEAEAWLRMWSNSVDSTEDFIEGLPGFDGNIKCTQAKEIHNKLKESDTFQELLVRYGTYQLLERGN